VQPLPPETLGKDLRSRTDQQPSPGHPWSPGCCIHQPSPESKSSPIGAIFNKLHLNSWTRGTGGLFIISGEHLSFSGEVPSENRYLLHFFSLIISCMPE
ncbi:hypothetical protein QML37_30385, partial [Klebsiella pneumoniae]|uniref:hypothetical protein n=1 Tax=Klebsiella pneumoniae TaxID=573 RepID=UPI003A813873